jgi:hypothetical protein
LGEFYILGEFFILGEFWANFSQTHLVTLLIVYLGTYVSCLWLRGSLDLSCCRGGLTVFQQSVGHLGERKERVGCRPRGRDLGGRRFQMLQLGLLILQKKSDFRFLGKYFAKPTGKTYRQF